MSTEPISSFGFVCELSDDIAKIYTIENGIVEIKNTEELELGIWCEFDGDEVEVCMDYEDEKCEVYVEDEEVFVKVLAIGPNDFALPKDIRTKYKNAVWSPFLKFLDDGDDLFKNNIRGGDVVELIVKYAPSDKFLFKIVELLDEDPEGYTAYICLPPWTLEFIGKNIMEAAFPKPNQIAYNQLVFSSEQDFHIGICIKARYPNVAFKQDRKPSAGSKELCSYLFCPAVGLARWVITELENTSTSSSSKPAEYNVQDDMFKADKRLGSWVFFKLTEAKKYGKAKNSMGVRALQRTTATQVKEVQNHPRETKVVNGEIEIETSFLFDGNKLESEGSRLIGDWGVRHQQLKKDAHFWDVYLGRVEVYPHISRMIIETIEAHRHSLDPEEAKKLKNEAIVVSVTAIVHKNLLQNFEKYPHHGLFFAKAVDIICYLNGGKIIYQK